MRSVARKLEYATKFANIIVRELNEKVHKIVIFGSVAKEVASEESDVDVLIVLESISDEDRKVIADAAFRIGVESSESIEYILMSLEEYLTREEDNPLIHEVKTYGKTLYINPNLNVKRLDDGYGEGKFSKVTDNGRHLLMPSKNVAISRGTIW